jgi:sulfonate transport system permease protein
VRRRPPNAPSTPERVAWSAAGVLVMLAAWELAAYYMSRTNPRAEQIFPSWSIILTKSVREFDAFVPFGDPSSGYIAALNVLAHHSLITTERVFEGTLIGIFAGILAGLLMAYSSVLRETIGPILNLIRTVPLLALIPLFVLWFGGRTIGIILFIAFAVFVMMVVSTFHAAQDVPVVQRRFARTMGASRARMFRDVVVPGMIPELFAAIRIAFALSWSFALGGEFTGAQDGLGFLMIRSQQFGYLGRVVVVVVLFTAFSVLIDSVLVTMRRSLVRWAPA